MTSTGLNRSPARPALGVAMVVAAATVWGLNGTVSKLLIRGGFDPPQLTTFRATGAFLVLLLLILVTRGPRPLAAAPREVPRLMVYGLIGIFGVPLLYFVAISRLPVGIGLLFEFTAPVFVALWVRFGERRPVHRRLWVGLVLAIAGLVSVAQLWSVFAAGGGLRLDGLGMLAGLSSAVLLATWYVLGSRYVAGRPQTPGQRRRSTPTVRDPLTLTCWSFGVAAVAGAVVRPWWNFDWGLLAGRSEGQPMWLLAAYFIVFGTIVPYLLLTYAMRHLPPTSVGIVSMTEIVLASGFAWLLLAEALSTAQIVGGLILVAGVALAESARVAGTDHRAADQPAADQPATDRASDRADDRAADQPAADQPATDRADDRAADRPSDRADDRAADRTDHRAADRAADRTDHRAADQPAADRASDRAADPVAEPTR